MVTQRCRGDPQGRSWGRSRHGIDLASGVWCRRGGLGGRESGEGGCSATGVAMVGAYTQAAHCPARTTCSLEREPQRNRSLETT
eukprot:366338-Chlamydomonas_euryale.AAC.6